ncbi:hypothetical protein N1851_016802 [Merluccius polli]|uniref:CCHC-type domain-containing protein n=1 Tax=Merluccius polli TaxID=89951 RepID=A0AA47MQF1_MERPO|nr:hypothetical protein N1851_016802 [Merluccius polli]
MEAGQAYSEYPLFKEFVDFLSKEADLACDPISSVQALKGVESDKPKYPRSHTVQAKTLSTNTSQNNIPSCIFCKRVGHVIAKCRKLAEKYISRSCQAEKLCFGCLKTGHHSRSCDNRSTCEKCQKRHPTCLHDDQFRERLRSTPLRRDISKEILPKREIAATATTNRVMQEGPNTQTSLISDTTFILDEVAQDLDTAKRMLACGYPQCLQVRGYNFKKRILLHHSLHESSFQQTGAHIPTSETALKWPHLEKLADKIPPPIRLLEHRRPFKTQQVTFVDAIGTSHRIIVRQVTPSVQPSVELKGEVHFVCRTQIKEITPTEIIRALKSDFTDHTADDNSGRPSLLVYCEKWDKAEGKRTLQTPTSF